MLTGVPTVLGTAKLGPGIAAIVTGSGGILAAFTIAIVAMWTLATARTLSSRTHQRQGAHQRPGLRITDALTSQAWPPRPLRWARLVRRR
ncbi:MAG TPA: hypothetical protein VLW50_04625 [Streptosporangiaceae bacterium]|nr:hypothetical protein [Streptosporangiaceae bacterium]